MLGNVNTNISERHRLYDQMLSYVLKVALPFHLVLHLCRYSPFRDSLLALFYRASLVASLETDATQQLTSKELGSVNVGETSSPAKSNFTNSKMNFHSAFVLPNLEAGYFIFDLFPSSGIQ